MNSMTVLAIKFLFCRKAKKIIVDCQRFVLSCIFLPCLFLLPIAVNAAEPSDVRLLIDVSGSMKLNDSNNLRRPAVDLLVKLLPEGSRAGVWTFGQSVNMLVPHGRVNDAWRNLAAQKINQINSNGLYTNIGGVLEKAAFDSKNTNNNKEGSESVAKTNLILLTDGMVDVSKNPKENEQEWRRIVDEILPELKEAGYRIHTIALSDNADTELLNKLSLVTDGVAAVANNADELMKIFLKALDSSSPPAQVPLRGNSFVVDSSVEEFTALIFPEPNSSPARLQSPDNTEYKYGDKNEDLNWYRTPEYDLITIGRPIEGEWQLLADLDSDSRVTIVSDLNLVVKQITNNALKGDSVELSLLLEEDGEKIIREDLLSILDVSYSIQRHNDGQAWFDVIPPDNIDKTSNNKKGVFTTSLEVFNKIGIYEIRVLVDGKSFKREFSHTIEVREPFMVESETIQANSKTHFVIKVTSSNDDIDISNTNIVANIKDPSNSNIIKTLRLTNVGSWALDFMPEKKGVYNIELKINSISKNGESFEFSPEAILKSYPEGADLFSDSSDQKIEEENVEDEPSKDIQAEEVSPIDASLEEAPKSKLWLYVGLGAGNLLILGLAFLAYRMIMGNKADSLIDGLEEKVASNSSKSASKSTSKKEEVDEKKNEKAEASAEPPVKDAENESQKEADLNMAHVKSDSKESSSDETVEGITDVEFSLDDFVANESEVEPSDLESELEGELNAQHDDEDDIDAEINSELGLDAEIEPSNIDDELEFKIDTQDSSEVEVPVKENLTEKLASDVENENDQVVKDEFDLSVDDSDSLDSDHESESPESKPP